MHCFARLRSFTFSPALLGFALVFAALVRAGAESPPDQLTIKTSNGAFDFTVEIADEAHERQQGLMHRTHMDPKHGMLFVFDRQQIVTMWMQNTPLSLDMIFIKPDGTVATVARRTTPFSTDVITSRVPVSHVFEVNAGISTLIGLKEGDKVFHPTFTGN